jgi:hypothetical protein
MFFSPATGGCPQISSKKHTGDTRTCFSVLFGFMWTLIELNLSMIRAEMLLSTIFIIIIDNWAIFPKRPESPGA